MSTNELREYADRVRDRYRYHAHTCDRLASGVVETGDLPEDLHESAPAGARMQAGVLATTALSALSVIWKRLSNPTPRFQGKDWDTYIGFLHALPPALNLRRIATPFLWHALECREIEDHFREAVYLKWVRGANDHEAHRVCDDPDEATVRALYTQCEQAHASLPNAKKAQNIDETLHRFTYAGLIYALYRNPAVHENVTSENTTTFGKIGEPIRVLLMTGVQHVTTDQSGGLVLNTQLFTHPNTGQPIARPYLDVPISVLTEAIREGADLIHDLILRNGFIPPGLPELKVPTRG